MYGYAAVIAAAAAVCLAVYILLRRHYEKKMKETYRKLLQSLDRALAGELPEISYDESMDGAVMERIGRILRAYHVNHDKAGKERDAIQSLISDISHQIRTPLAGIMLYGGLLKEQKLSPETESLADKIQKQSEKLDFFMKELIRTSYIEQEMISISPEKIEVESIVDMAFQNVELAALKRGVTLVRREISRVCYADRKWTAEALGNQVERLYDVGVAGLHRLISHMDSIMNARVIIAIAGMEGALASVIGGLADCPVIAVPTSIGYGASFGGVSALLSMLNSCASGVSVVNIDNGFGAGYLASMMNHMRG